MHPPQHSTHAASTAPAGEAGFMLLTVVVMTALVLIALAVAAPVVARQIRRDKEVESMHRAEQYVRAIRMFQRACKCQAYPPSMDALEKNTTTRFLRQRYVDPLTGKSDWRLIHDPQTKIHPFFGKSFDDLPAGSLGSAQSLATTTGGPVSIGAGTSSTSTIGATSPLASGFGGASTTTTTGGAPGATGTAGTAGATGAASGTGTTPSAGSTSDAGIFGDSAGGIIKGVGTSRSGDSILDPNKQTTYETWEFWWDPRMEQLYAKSKILGGGGIGTVDSTPAGSLGKDAVSGQPNSGSGSSPGTTSPAGTPGSTSPTAPNPSSPTGP